MTIRRVALFDIDGVLAASWNRSALIDTESWDAFHAASVEDEPIEEILDIAHAMYETELWYIVLLTGRPEKWRNITMRWLLQHDAPMHELLMRPDDDYRPAAEVKLDIIRTRWPGLNPKATIVFEDHEPTAAAWRGLGFTTLLVTAYNR
jgi:hypothetical protein